MSLRSYLRETLSATFHRTEVESDLDEELRSHISRHADDLERGGLSRAEAERRARIAFGSYENAKEKVREERPAFFLDTLASDVRFGLRMLRKDRSFAAVAILTLALGIGANTTIFSLLNDLLLRRLPFPGVDRLALIWETDIHDAQSIRLVSLPNFRDWEKENHVFENMALFDSSGRGYNLSQGNSEPESVSGVRVSENFFSVLGVQPMLGRAFLAEENIPGRDHVVILSYKLWQRRYAGDPAILGKAIRVDGQDFTVVGVMPASFRFQFWSDERALWVPGSYTDNDQDRASHSFICIARMKPEITLVQAAAEMDTIGRRLMQQYPKENSGNTAQALSLAGYGLEDAQKTLVTLFAAVAFILLIACVNVANLMLSRSASRQKELSVRRVLGAPSRRILRQLLTESLILSLVGGVAGLALAVAGVRLLGTILPGYMTLVPLRPVTEVHLDTKVFLFALAISCVTGIVSGLAPALVAYRSSLNESLKESAGRGSTETGKHRLRHILVAAEVALALVVVAGAALLVTSVTRILSVNPGFDPRNVLAMDITTPQVNLYVGPPSNPLYCQELRQHLGAVPGVLSVSSISNIPLEGRAGRIFTVEGETDSDPEHRHGAWYSVACPDFFRTLGIPILEGRDFNDRDTVNSAGVVIISQDIAKRYWNGKDPLGSKLKIGGIDSDEPWLTVVGVSKDVRGRGLDRDINPIFYRPFTQAGWPSMRILARTASSPMAYSLLIKRALAEINPDAPASQFRTVEDVVTNSVGDRRFPMLLLSVFALLALTLAAVGIYGVVSYGVSQRTQEIGIRMAFGAKPSNVLGLVVGGSLKWTIGGVAFGLLGAYCTGKLLSGLLYRISASDPFLLFGVSFLLLGVALLASYIPARRAMRVDPIVALRYE
jgi:predicted permease